MHEYYANLMKKAYENRVYKWNVLFDYSTENLLQVHSGKVKEIVQKLSQSWTPAVTGKGYCPEGSFLIEKTIKQVTL